MRIRRPGFWDERRRGRAQDEMPSRSLEGQRLGPYRIVRKLGSGGMGDVYLAERADEEYQQRVAIKLVRAGCSQPQVQSRLRTERQILATLQHPNIARLLDGGRAPDGTPYLVMEYIDGEPIDAYCDRRRLPLERAHRAGAHSLRGGPLRASEPDRASRPEAEQHPDHARGRTRSCSTSASPSCSTRGTRRIRWRSRTSNTG